MAGWLEDKRTKEVTKRGKRKVDSHTQTHSNMYTDRHTNSGTRHEGEDGWLAGSLGVEGRNLSTLERASPPRLLRIYGTNLAA